MLPKHKTRVRFPHPASILKEDILMDLVEFIKHVGKLLDSKLQDIGRIGMICEGFGINHAYVKLLPIHGMKVSNWEPQILQFEKHFEKYGGYIFSRPQTRG